MTNRDDAAAAMAANASQAAQFRKSLVAERAQLVESIVKRRVIIDRRSHANHMRSQVRAAEVQVRDLDRLIEQLDRRFSPHWGRGG